ncbi:MAG: nucleotidyltransferase domain-containing protein [Syntrophaceticus schinkii]
MEHKIYQIDEIKEMFLPIFEAAPIYRAILFGSYAKGKATEESDIDIVVDCMGGIINVSYFSLLADITTLLRSA